MPSPARAHRASRRVPCASDIPRFALYGEAPAPGRETLHIETVQSRSRLYAWEIRPHVHQDLYQALWLSRGAADVSIDERLTAVESPAAIIVPPGVVHGFRFEPETDGFVMTLTARLIVEGSSPEAAEAFRALFLVPGVIRLSPDDAASRRIDALMRDLAAEFSAPDGAGSPAAGWLARAVVWRLARARALVEGAETARGRRHQALFSRFLLLVEEHVLERWPLGRYARALGLSTQRLNRLAHAESGRSALEIVHERLTREACRKLFYIAAPAETLAAELGFDDPAYFNRFFKRRMGMTPRQWRERAQAAP